MRPLLLALAAATAFGLAACGGDGDDAAPLALEERVPTAEEAPGTESDPVEKRETAEGTDEFITKLSDLLVDASPEAKADFEEAGFLRAISDTRFMPEEPGAPHTPDAPHVFSFVAQFESDEGAETGLDLIYRDSLRPCPETCATRLDEFDVGDIPDAHGVRRYATAETIAELGEDGEPYDSYEVQFADGQYAYHISFQGGMGDVSQEEVEEIARKLYERVKGAPPPSS